MCVKRWVSFLVVVGIVFLGSWEILRADLDINPSDPGSPLDWNDWKPGLTTPVQDTVLSGEPRESHKPDEPDVPEENGSTVMDMDEILEQVPRGITYRFSFDPWAESGVTTVDIAQHLPWFGVAPAGWNDPPDPHPSNYEPNPSNAFRYKMLGHYVRLHLYPQMVAIPDLINSLIEIGQPAQFAAMRVSGSDEAGNSMMIPKVANAVLDAIGNPPIKLAKPKKDASPMTKFLVLELGRGYPYDYDSRFGQNVIALGEDAVPDLIKLAEGYDHMLVRRNAVYMLRFFPQPEVVTSLRKIVAGDDKVARVRALRALTKRSDRVIVPFLLNVLKDEKADLYWKHFCAYSLGRLGIGNDEAGKAVVDWVKPAFKENKRGDGGDVIWTGLCSLARMRYDTKESRMVYQKARKRFGSRADRVHQAALLAQSAIGGKEALKEINDLIKASSLKGLDRSVVGVALDVLGYAQEFVKKEFLMDIAMDKRNSIMTRYYALRLRRFTKKDEKMLLSFALDRKKVEPVLRTVSMLRLWEISPPKALDIAKNVVVEFVSKGNKITGDRANEVLLAIQMLGPSKRLTYAELGKLLNKTVADARKGEKLAGAQDIDARTFFIPAPLFENVLLEMARLQTDQSERDIIAVLLNPKMPARPLAARALGLYGSEKSMRALIDVTEDMKNPMVRLFANLSLEKLTGLECPECDWMSDSKAEIFKGVTFWNTWWAENYTPKPEEGNDD